MWSWLLNLLGLGKPTPRRMTRRLQNARPEERCEAVATLSAVPESWAIDLLVPLFADVDPGVRDATRTALMARGAAVVPSVYRGIDRTTEIVAKRSIGPLADLRDATAVAALLQSLKFSARPLQLYSKQALIRSGPVAVPALEAAALAEENPWIRR